MRALQLQEWGGPLLQVELPTPEPGPGEVRRRVRTCGVGDTLNNMRSGRNRSMPGASLPRVIGHEVAGVIDAVGPDVVGWAPGRRAYVYMYLTCGRCEACRDYERRMKREDRLLLAGLIAFVVFAGLLMYFSDVLTR
jgi:propanol-preferring alcohol dehydrogenase